MWNAVVDNLEFETLLLFAFVSANGPLSFQQSPPLQSKTNSDDVSLHRYCFSGPKSRVALCRCLRTAIVSAGRSRALLCADVCGLLLFQRSEVEHRFVQMSADCYCFSCPESSVALCRCLRTAIVSAVQSRALLVSAVRNQACSVQMSADCYCFSGPKSSIALCTSLRTAIVSAV